MPNKKLPITALTALGFQLNTAIERGLGSQVSFDDVHQGLESGTLFEILEEKLPGEMDLSSFSEEFANRGPNTIEALNYAAPGTKGDEQKTYGVKSNGLSLLMAYTLEAIQQTRSVNGNDDDDDLMNTLGSIQE